MERTGTAYADVEIGLHAVQAEAIDGEVPYTVELRFRNPKNEAERQPKRGECKINYAELFACQRDPAAYGAMLSRRLFASPAVLAEYQQIKAVVEAYELSLRVRLLIGLTAPRLHFVRWEMLLDPDTQAPLATSEKMLFSRFLASDNWSSVRLRPKKRLRALIAVSAPSDLAKYNLAEVDAGGEVERAQQQLKGIEVSVAGMDAPLTLKSLLDVLRTEIDVLYLVCHGTFNRRHESLLFLQDEAGLAAPVNGTEFATRISELLQPPRLALLASCESGGNEDAVLLDEEPMAAHAALAPRLAEAGIPAIMAMQGKITMETVKLAMPVFFRELLVDGQIDRAMAVARGEVRDRLDCWMMTLFLRLKSGQIWYEAGFTGDGSDFSKWKSLCRRVHAGKFIPILGPDVDEGLYGGMAEISSKLAAQHTFPLRPAERFDVAKVLQYLSIYQDPDFAQSAVQVEMLNQIVEHSKDLAGKMPPETLPDAMEMLVAARRQDRDDPFRILAELPAPIYITASPETFLVKSIRAQGKKPEVLFCPWRPTATNHPKEPQPANIPTKDAPLVYPVFGTFSKKDSLVLTEDDFFDYLIAVSTYKLIPNIVRGSLMESSLLFLGFRLDDWTFRVLFRLIMTLEGCGELRQYSHVGVQVNPDEHSMADVKRARLYLESYFSKNQGAPIIDIFWGSARDFLKQLRDQLAIQNGIEAAPVAQGKSDDWF